MPKQSVVSGGSPGVALMAAGLIALAAASQVAFAAGAPSPAGRLPSAARDAGQDDAAAAREARRVIALDGAPSELAGAHLVLARIDNAAGRLETAFNHYREAIAYTAADRRGEPLLEFGLALYAAAKYPEAASILRKATEADPKLSRAHGELGNALAQMGKNEEAALAYRRAIQLDPGDDGAKDNLRIVEGRLEAAPRQPKPRPDSRPAPGAANPSGHYQIVAYAGWAQTSIQADFTLRPDGTAIDNWAKETWRWSYDAAAGAVKFTGGPYAGASVTFKPGESRLGVLLIKWPDLDEPAWAYRESK